MVDSKLEGSILLSRIKECNHVSVWSILRMKSKQGTDNLIVYKQYYVS